MNDQQHNSQQEPIRFLVFSASLRNDSLNTRLAKLAARVIEKNGGRVDFANMNEFQSRRGLLKGNVQRQGPRRIQGAPVNLQQVVY